MLFLSSLWAQFSLEIDQKQKTPWQFQGPVLQPGGSLHGLDPGETGPPCLEEQGSMTAVTPILGPGGGPSHSWVSREDNTAVKELSWAFL